MADIHNIGVTALNVYQRALNMTGHNVANVHTPGYSRQRSEPVAQDTIFAKGYYLGTGVKDTAVVRAYDDFLLGQMRASQSAKSDAQAFYRIGSQVNRLIAGENTGLDPMLQGFFDAVQTLADDPASTPVRELLLAESQALVDRFRFLDGSLNRARDEVHSEIRNAVGEVNNLARTIAQLNKDISDSFGIHQGIWPNDLLDQRDNAINELTRYISINTIKQDDGTTTVYFGKGQPLVLGEESHSLSVVDSSLIPNHKEIAYVSGGVGGITSDQIAGGELEGLLRARDQFLEQGRNQLGLVALGLSMEVNAQHREGINLMDQTGLDFFSDLSVTQSTNSYLNAAGSDYLFDITVTDLTRLPAADFSLQYLGGGAGDLGNYRLTNETDDSTVSLTAPPAGFPWDLSADLGIEIDLASGASISVGDRFFLNPTSQAAARLSLEIHDARAIAAASPMQVDPAAGNTGSVAISLPSITQVNSSPVRLGDANPGNDPDTFTLTFSNNAGGAGVPGFLVAASYPGGPTGPLLYDPATQATGQTYLLDMNGYHLDFTVTGQPGTGDVFTFGNGTSARPSDNRNAQLIGDLQSWKGLLGGNAGFQEAFGAYVADAGSRTRQSEGYLDAQERMLELNRDSLEGVKGVNLDEEAANLIRFQQAYQAAAQLISTASNIFDSLIAAVR